MPRRRGRRGEGSVLPVRVGKRTRYRARWSSTEGGKRKRGSHTFDFKADADWWLREAKRTGTAPDVSITVEVYLNRWLASVKPRVRPSTWESYRGHVEQYLVPELGGFSLLGLLPRHVDTFVQQQLARVSPKTGRPLSPTYVRSILTTLRMALGQAVKRREIPDNAAADAVAPSVTVRRIDGLTDDQADAIRDATSETWLGPFVEFMLGSALRPGEATGLNQGDLHLDDGYVSLRVSKTEIRAVPLSDDAIEAARTALIRAPRRGRNEPVFFGPKSGDRLRVWSVTHALGELTERLGLPRLTAHGLRHGAATIALAHGASLRHVQEQLGHRSPRMTARYAHVIPEQARATAKLLNRRAR